MKRIVLLGCPGAGKGTQAEFIRDRYDIPVISTGNILRASINQNTELGKKVKVILEQGHLVSDDVVTELVRERVKQVDCKNGFLLDGFPRTMGQAQAMHQFTSIDYVIDIQVPLEDIVKRLSGRRVHAASGRTYHTQFQPPRIPNQDDLTGEPLIQRSDDSEDVVRKRIDVYQAQTNPLRDFYQHFDKEAQNPPPVYARIDGLGSVEGVRDKIFAVLDR